MFHMPCNSVCSLISPSNQRTGCYTSQAVGNPLRGYCVGKWSPPVGKQLIAMGPYLVIPCTYRLSLEGVTLISFGPVRQTRGSSHPPLIPIAREVLRPKVGKAGFLPPYLG